VNANYVIIMAGGVGSRFWPVSRETRPKQFLDILGIGKSLIRLTYERFIKIVPPENIYVITNEKYRSLVRQHLPELTEQQVIGEPCRNNTAPCVAYAAFKLHALDPDANLLVAPSDHYIHDLPEFVRTVQQGFDFTGSQDAILTLGMKPTRPDTGYGYIELEEEIPGYHEVYRTRRFTEKPDLEAARTFLESGRYCWNSGMFFFRGSTILADFKKHAPEIYRQLAPGEALYNTPGEEAFIQEHYPKTPNISIDYAIMEKADHIYCLRADFGWSDLGTWGSLYDFKDKDENENVVLSGRLDPVQSRGMLSTTRSDKTIIVKDLDDYYIIDEDDILVIWPRKDEDQLTGIRKQYE
jgi:mannose-1-phosphate guanylyltransferase